MNEIVAWIESHDINTPILLATFGLLAAGWLGIFLINRLLRRWLMSAGALVGLRSGRIVSVVRITTAILWGVVGLLLLDLWGVSVGGIWAVLASVATIIGVGFLATWAMVSNITASVFLAIWRPFRLGDSVEMLPENLKGRAVERNLMFTVLREESGAVLQIPNNLFFQKMFRVGGS